MGSDRPAFTRLIPAALSAPAPFDLRLWITRSYSSKKDLQCSNANPLGA